MMFGRFLKSNFLKRSVIFVTITAVFTAVISIFMVGFSADSYTQYELDDYDILRVINNSVSSYSILANSGTGYYSYCKTSSSGLNYTALPLTQQSFSLHEKMYYYNPIYIDNTSGTINFVINCSLPFSYTVKGGDTFTLAFAGSSSYVYQIQVLTSEGDLLTCTFASTSQAISSSASPLYYYYSLFGNRTLYYMSNAQSSTSMSLGTSGLLLTVTLPATDSYYSIDSITIYQQFNSTYDSMVRPCFSIVSLPYYYEENGSGGGTDYSPQLEEILSTLDDVDSKLDGLNEGLFGEPPSEAMSELASETSQQNAYQEIINGIEGDINDYIDDNNIFEPFEDAPEMPTEDIELTNSYFPVWQWLTDTTELIPRLISFGCAMLIVFTLFKRF